MRQSMRTRLLKTFLILFLAAMLLFASLALIGMWTLRDSAQSNAQRLGQAAAQNSERLLIDQALDAAQSFVVEKAVAIDERMSSFLRAVDEMALYMAALYEHPERFASRPVPTPDELAARGESSGTTLHYLPATLDLASTSEQIAENALLGNTEEVFAAILLNTPEISSIYVASASGANVDYDANAENKTGFYAFECRGLPWYISARDSGTLVISETYADSFGRGLTVTISKPFYAKGTFIGVLGVDLLIEGINREILSTQFGSGGYAMLFSSDGKAISAKNLSESGFAQETLLGTQSQEVIRAMRESAAGYVRSVIHDEPVYIIYAPVATTGWNLTVVMPIEEILAPATRSNEMIQGIIKDTHDSMARSIKGLNLAMILAFATLAVVFIAIVRSVCRRSTEPILKLTEDVGHIGEGNLDYRSDIHTGDEVELLSQSFERMTSSLRAYIHNLTRVTAERERIGAELSVATKIQTGMLPCTFPPFPDQEEFDLFATMLPAKEVGGDFYDFFLIDADHLAFLIADVSGKGIPAALFMMTVKTLIKTLAQTGIDLSQVFNEANARLYENNEESMFVTAWMGVLEISTGRLDYVNAGHTPPFLRREGKGFRFLRSRAGFVLAGLETTQYQKAELSLHPGDILYLYTDGVTEATDTENASYGEARLVNVLDAQPGEDLRKILGAVQEDIDRFIGQAPQFDDITMLALRFGHSGEGGMKSLTVPARADQLYAVLDFLTREIKTHDCPPRALARLNLVAEEVFINIARYAYSPEEGDLTVQIGVSGAPSTLTLRFIDRGVPYNPLEKADPDIALSAGDRQAGGLGIYLVKKSVDSAHYAYENGQNILTLTQTLA